jgi:hypothetical protein
MNKLIFWANRAVLVFLLVVVRQGVAQTPEVSDSEHWPSHQVYHLLEARATYLLDFDKIYETTASLDVETIVTLPKGYTFTLSRSGSFDYINAYVMQNSLFFTRTIDHAFTTSLICNVIVPTGETRQLIFKIRGGAKEPIVYGIHFTVLEKQEDTTAVTRTLVEKSCVEDIDIATVALSKKLDGEIYERTMIETRPAFFAKHRGKMKKEYKGATVYIDGVIYARGEAFVYLYSNVKRDMCDVVKLVAIAQGRKKNRSEIPATLVISEERMDGKWAYVYRVPLSLPPQNKKVKTIFLFEIWSRMLTYKTVMS